jgi:hypothetical protein
MLIHVPGIKIAECSLMMNHIGQRERVSIAAGAEQELFITGS